MCLFISAQNVSVSVSFLPLIVVLFAVCVSVFPVSAILIYVSPPTWKAWRRSEETVLIDCSNSCRLSFSFAACPPGGGDVIRGKIDWAGGYSEVVLPKVGGLLGLGSEAEGAKVLLKPLLDAEWPLGDMSSDPIKEVMLAKEYGSEHRSFVGKCKC